MFVILPVDLVKKFIETVDSSGALVGGTLVVLIPVGRVPTYTKESVMATPL